MPRPSDEATLQQRGIEIARISLELAEQRAELVLRLGVLPIKRGSLVRGARSCGGGDPRGAHGAVSRHRR